MIKRRSFRTKLTLSFVVLLVIISSAVMLLIYSKALQAHKKQLRQGLIAIASTGAALIDAEKHAKISPQKSSEDLDSYKELKLALKKIRDANPGVRYVYTMTKTDDSNYFQFIIDAEEEARFKSSPGERYNVINHPYMRAAFEGAAADEEFEKDNWGVWLSGYAPIKDKNGNAIAILGVDMSAEDFLAAQKGIHKRTAAVFIAALFLSAILGVAVSRTITVPIKKLSEATGYIAKGDFSHKVKLDTKDELEDLANSLNSMVDELNSTYSDLNDEIKENERLYKELQGHVLNTIYSLSDALEAKDPYTRGHSERVKEYSINIAKELKLGDDQIKVIKEISVLHDIGKIGVPEDILNKPGKLTDAEWREIKNHPLIGETILRSLELLKPGLSMVRHHHERFDGKGYPDGLKDTEIPRMASIVTVADAYDAMTSPRPYRPPMAKEEAIQELKQNSSTQFDPEVVNALVKIIG